MAYWLNVFTVESWSEFKAAGGRIAGFPAKQWVRVQKIRPGDKLLVYLSGEKTWVAVLDVVGEPFYSPDPPIWKAQPYPARVEVQTILELVQAQGVPMEELLPHLPKFGHMRDHGFRGWGGFFMSPPTLWSDQDGMVVEKAIREAIDKA